MNAVTTVLECLGEEPGIESRANSGPVACLLWTVKGLKGIGKSCSQATTMSVDPDVALYWQGGQRDTLYACK